MYKGWISRRGRESIERGCKPLSQWTNDELKALFKANKENVPSIIYDYLDSVDPKGQSLISQLENFRSR